MSDVVNGVARNVASPEYAKAQLKKLADSTYDRHVQDIQTQDAQRLEQTKKRSKAARPDQAQTTQPAPQASPQRDKIKGSRVDVTV
jgi:hypothetical protein